MADQFHIDREKRRTLAANSPNAAYCEDCGFLAIADHEISAEQFLKAHTCREVTTRV